MRGNQQHFSKKKDFLICIDSDGCAMNTMEVKHIHCFGPPIIEIWELEGYRDSILKRWNEINLYSKTRGINRFKALAIILQEIDEHIKKIEDLSSFLEWEKSSKELSNQSLEKVLKESNSLCLKQILAWSETVNLAIRKLPDTEGPFNNVQEVIKVLSEFADIAVVSSANYEAVRDEWTKYGLIQFVDVLMTQELGSKTVCIRELKEKGYGAENVMMVGDAVGDHEAALDNKVLFFPILVGKEAQSWENLAKEAAIKFKLHTYQKAYQESLVEIFYKNFKK